jgi:hypothetical protein
MPQFRTRAAQKLLMPSIASGDRRVSYPAVSEYLTGMVVAPPGRSRTISSFPSFERLVVIQGESFNEAAPDLVNVAREQCDYLATWIGRDVGTAGLGHGNSYRSHYSSYKRACALPFPDRSYRRRSAATGSAVGMRRGLGRHGCMHVWTPTAIRLCAYDLSPTLL